MQGFTRILEIKWLAIPIISLGFVGFGEDSPPSAEVVRSINIL